MCGIAGIWRRSGAPVAPELLERMGAVLVHRGPDGGGVYLEGGLGLVNRRLRIVDVSPEADQPLALEQHGLCITYNGEVHNYVELRRELEALGSTFRTHTDTEVVLHAYARWGLGCFARFNGMWALAIWDARREELVLSRDRFGIKPLALSVRRDRVAFASEPKAILAAFPEERVADGEEVARFLSGGTPDLDGRTFFANVESVPAGQTLVFTRDGSRAHTYWDFEPGAEEPRPDAAEELRELLREAVALRLRSDVPVGACLSGGIDSSAIVRLMPPPGAEPRPVFSLRYPGEPRTDESRYAAAAAAGGGFEVHWVEPDPRGLVETMRRITWHHDAPTSVRGRVAAWFVLQEAARHVKVVVDGEGGDELLAGYSRCVFPYLVDRVRRGPARLGLLRELPRLGEIESRSRLWFLAHTPLAPAKRALGLPPWPGRGVAATRIPRRRWSARERPYASALNNLLWHELRRDGLPEVLHLTDAISMAFSVESRPPFLDHRVAELCLSLPFHEKIAGGVTKSVLRRALEGVVPPEILDRRRKMGFPAPLRRYLALPENRRDVEALLLDRRTLERGVFDPRRLERALRAGPSPGRVWRWVTLELWFRDFVDRPPEV